MGIPGVKPSNVIGAHTPPAHHQITEGGVRFHVQNTRDHVARPMYLEHLAPNNGPALLVLRDEPPTSTTDPTETFGTRHIALLKQENHGNLPVINTHTTEYRPSALAALLYPGRPQMLDATAGKDRTLLWLELLGNTPMKFGAAAGASAVTLGIKMTDDTARALAKAPTTWREATELQFLMTHAKRQAHHVDGVSKYFERWVQDSLFARARRNSFTFSSADHAIWASLEQQHLSGGTVSTTDMVNLLIKNGAEADDVAWLRAAQQLIERAGHAANNAARSRHLQQLANQGVGTGATPLSAVDRLAQVEGSAGELHYNKVLIFLFLNRGRLNADEVAAIESLAMQELLGVYKLEPALADELYDVFRRVATPAERLAADLLQLRWDGLSATRAELEGLSLLPK